MNVFPANQVFQSGDIRMRLIYISGNLASWIDIDNPVAWPEGILTFEIEQQLIEGKLNPIDDPFLEVTLKSVEPESLEWHKREKAWAAIKEYVNDPGLLQSSERGSMVQAIMVKHKLTKQTVYRYLRRYWQRGMSSNALLPDYHRSGGAGKRRKPGKKKLGRPRVIAEGKGSNITPEIERIFRTAIESELLKKKPASISGAHVAALRVIRSTTSKKTAYEVPTLRQFDYFFKREYSTVERIRRRTSDIDYASNIRPILSTSTQEAIGPGYRYQIDATIADIYLISEQDHSKIVGRPVVYLVIDVFSRMVAGLYVGFDGPSWTSAMIALANTAMDKVAYCRQFDLEISELDWPVQGLPDKILADKGELNGTKVEQFCAAFGVSIENAPARRGDAKGIVERNFRTIQGDFKPYVAGVVGKEISRKRGGEDYRRDATLTLKDFTKTIICSILCHNNYLVVKAYDRCEGMQENIPSVPLHLWNWGLANLTGKLRTAPMDLVRINLMPHAEATVSALGIRLFGCFYTCADALKLGWFHRAGSTRPEKVIVAYDPQLADHIYLRPSGNLKEYSVCDLADRSRRFKNHSFWDVWNITQAEKQANTNASLEGRLAKGKLLDQIETISKKAEERKSATYMPPQKNLGMQIRENKQEEKRVGRAKGAFKPVREQRKTPAEVIPLRKEEKSSYGYPDLKDLLFENDSDEYF